MPCPPNCSEEDKAKIVAQHNPPSGVLKTNLENIKQEINLGSQSIGKGSLKMAETVKMNSPIYKKATKEFVREEEKNLPVKRMSSNIKKKKVKKSKIETLSDKFTEELGIATGKGTIYDDSTW